MLAFFVIPKSPLLVVVIVLKISFLFRESRRKRIEIDD